MNRTINGLRHLWTVLFKAIPIMYHYGSTATPMIPPTGSSLRQKWCATRSVMKEKTNILIGILSWNWTTHLFLFHKTPNKQYKKECSKNITSNHGITVAPYRLLEIRGVQCTVISIAVIGLVFLTIKNKRVCQEFPRNIP